MKKSRIRKLAALAIFAVVLVASLTLYFLFFSGNSNALWEIVSQKCMSGQSIPQSSGVCLKVDEKKQYVLLKDFKGPYHDLLIPTFPVAGLESSVLEASETPPLMALAWAERGRIAEESGLPIRDEDLLLAINSRSGRTQNHLHIHISCLHKSVKESLARQADSINFQWSRLPEPIMGKDYFARRVAGHALTQENEFVLLNDLLRSEGLEPGSFGLGMAQLPDGDFVLLAKGKSLLPFDLGSPERLMDFTCAIAKKPG